MIVLGPDQDGRTIVCDGSQITDAPSGDGAIVLTCPDARLEPAWVNAHTHLYSGLAPLGMPAAEPTPENFLQILERVWWRLDRALDKASLRASARFYIANSLLKGTGTIVDHHESPDFIEGSLDVLADAAAELGARALVCFGATERNGGREEGRRGIEECARFIRENERPLVRGLVGLHASFTVSDETILDAAKVCRDLDTTLHVHVAEDGADVVDARERGYDGPLERLVQLTNLPAKSILAHGVHASAEQIQDAEDRGAWWVQNPRSNTGNAGGYASSLRDATRVALGTDGYPSDMLDEVAAITEKEDAEHARARLAGSWRLVEEHFGGVFGALSSGATADVVARRADGTVQHLVVEGRIIVRDGQLLTADIEAIRAEAQVEAERLWARMRAL